MNVLLFSLSKNKGDFVVQPFIGSGKGGQNRNKVMTGCRITHPESGAVQECQEERSFEQNKKKCFKRLMENETFSKWYKLECARHLGKIGNIEDEVNKAMNRPQDFKTEVCVNGKWEEV